jgi:hypothetical protein
MPVYKNNAGKKPEGLKRIAQKIKARLKQRSGGLLHMGNE